MADICYEYLNLMNKKSDIEIMSILNDFTTESSLLDLYESSNKENTIMKMLEKVSTVLLDSIASVFDMLSELFHKDGKISKDEYLKSRQGEMVFDYDIIKRQKYINNKANEGNKLHARILKGENVHDKVVHFVNDVFNTLDSKDGRNKIYATAAPLVYGYHTELKSTVSEFNNLRKNVYPKTSYPEEINTNDLKMIISTYKNLVTKSNNLTAMYFKEYDKLSRSDDKKIKTMKIK